MTDAEIIAMEKVGAHFRRELGNLIGSCLAQMPAAIEGEVLSHLSRLSDVYKAPYDTYLPIKRVNCGTSKDRETTAFLPDFLNID